MDKGDIRHLSVEGARVVTSAVRNGILQPAWCFNPADVDHHGGGRPQVALQDGVQNEDDAPGPLDRYMIRAVVTVQPQEPGQQGYASSVEAHHFASGETMIFPMPQVAQVAELTPNFVATAISRQILGYPIITRFVVHMA